MKGQISLFLLLILFAILTLLSLFLMNLNNFNNYKIEYNNKITNENNYFKNIENSFNKGYIKENIFGPFVDNNDIHIRRHYE